MFQADNYVNRLTASMKDAFGDRLLYVGLQGSYLRGEATEDSDIDMMVIIDQLSVQDLDSYRKIISGMEDFEKSCGFICGMDEFSCWNPLELCHLVHTTKDYYGTLSSLAPAYGRSDLINFIKVSLGNLYHELCHRYVHADRMNNVQKLPAACKNVFFILQNIYYLKTGVFYPTKKELLRVLDGMDREVMEMALNINSGESCEFEPAFEKLFLWCQRGLTACPGDAE